MNSTNIRDTYNAQNYQKKAACLNTHTHASKNEKKMHIFHSGETSLNDLKKKKVLLCLLVPIMYHSDAIHTSSVGNRIEKCNVFSCAQRSASFWVAFVRFLFYSPYILARLFVHRFHFIHFVCSSSLGCMSTAIHLFDSLCVSEWIHLFTLIYTWIFCSQWHSSLSSIVFFSSSFHIRSFFHLFSSILVNILFILISCFRAILFTVIVSQTQNVIWKVTAVTRWDKVNKSKANNESEILTCVFLFHWTKNTIRIHCNESISND